MVEGRRWKIGSVGTVSGFNPTPVGEVNAQFEQVFQRSFILFNQAVSVTDHSSLKNLQSPTASQHRRRRANWPYFVLTRNQVAQKLADIPAVDSGSC